jgi:hypothetical protein
MQAPAVDRTLVGCGGLHEKPRNRGILVLLCVFRNGRLPECSQCVTRPPHDPIILIDHITSTASLGAPVRIISDANV